MTLQAWHTCGEFHPFSEGENHPHRMMLPPPGFTVGMVSGFLQMWCLAFRPKSSLLVSSDQRIFRLVVWESFRCFWQTPSVLSCLFYWGVASVWQLYHNVLIGRVLQRWLSFWKVFPSPQRKSGALSVTIGFLVTFLVLCCSPRGAACPQRCAV